MVESGRNQFVDVTFAKADQRAKGAFQSIWKRMSGAAEEFHKAESTPTPEWVRWSPWDWCLSSKPGAARREMFVGWCGSRMVGFLSLWPGFDSKHAPGQATLYVEHLAAFPGDIDTPVWGRRFRKVGPALFAFAVHQSVERGHEGRLALHASNDVALAFYRSIEEKLGRQLYHPQLTNVLGPTPQAPRSDPTKPYLETQAESARGWLEGYRENA